MSEHTQRTNNRQRSWQCTAHLQNFRNRVDLLHHLLRVGWLPLLPQLSIRQAAPACWA
jgi:hypothetical protein